MEFSDEFFESLGNWQRGWRENQDKRELLAKEIIKHSESLPKKFKIVQQPCYRKRFLHKGELVDIVLNDKKYEGIVSWTTDYAFAERFKDLVKPDAVSGAIFEHTPEENEVILNIAVLWESSEFVETVNKYKESNPSNAEPLFHFQGGQG